jgi:hypothetical protein
MTNNGTRSAVRLLVTQPSRLLTNQLYRILYGNVLYFVVMFLVPLVVLLLLNGELIRVLRAKKAKRAQLLRGRIRQVATPDRPIIGCDERSAINGARYF